MERNSTQAMRAVADHAKAKGVQFCPGMPLIPSLKEVKESQSKRRGRAAAAQEQVTPHEGRSSPLDNGPPPPAAEMGEGTTLLGAATRVTPRIAECLQMHQTIGFFLFMRGDLL